MMNIAVMVPVLNIEILLVKNRGKQCMNKIDKNAMEETENRLT